MASVAGAQAVTLIHRYSFNDTSGTTAADSVGGASARLVNGANFAAFTPVASTGGAAAPATARGVVLPKPGRNFYNGIEEGTSNYVSLPAGLLPGTSATIEEWFQLLPATDLETSANVPHGVFDMGFAFSNATFTTVGPGQTTESISQYLVGSLAVDGKGESADPNVQGTGSRIGIAQGVPAGEFDAVSSATSAVNGGDAGYLDDGHYEMIAAVVDGRAGTLSYYINGNLQSTVAESVPLTDLDDTTNYLGASPFFGDDGTYGAIDEFRIYDGAAGPAQVAADYAAGADTVAAAVPEPAAMAAWLAVTAACTCGRRRRQPGA